MVLIKKIKQFLSGAFFWIAAMAVILFIMNIVHFVWYYMRPEGVMEFLYFLKVLGVIVIIFFVAIILIVLLIFGLTYLFSNFPKNFTVKNVLKKTGYFILVLFIFSLNFFQMDYLSLKFYQTFSNKYKHLRRSRSLVADGKLDKAMEESRNAKVFAFEERKPWPVFALTNLYRRTEGARFLKADEEFAATINMGFILGQSDSLQNEAMQEFSSALELASTGELANRSGYKVYPLAALVAISLRKGDREQADKYNIALFEQVSHADREDIEYFIDCQNLVADEFFRNGDEHNAAKLWIINNDLYEQAELEKNINYLESLLQATNGRLIRNELDKAGELLVKAKELAEDRKKKPVYIDYLLTLAKYCEKASINGGGNEDLIKKGFISQTVNWFTNRHMSLTDRFATATLDIYDQILEKTEDRYGRESDAFASMQLFLAQLNLNKNRIQRTKQIIESIDRDKLSHDQQDRLEIFQILTDSSNAITEEGKNSLRKIEQSIYKSLSERIIFLTEAQRSHYLARVQENIQMVNDIYLRTGDSSLVATVYNNILAIKNISLYVNAYIRTGILQELSIVNDPLFKDLLDNTINASDLEKQVLEKKILAELRKRPTFHLFDPRNVSWWKVSDSLKANEVAVEFFRSVDPRKNNEETYYAFLLSHGSKPSLVKLFNAKELSDKLNIGSSLKSSTDSIYRQSLAGLTDLLIGPILRAAPSGTHFLLSPAGKLHQIAWAPLFMDKQLTYEVLGSTRLIADKFPESAVANTAYLFGGIDYGTIDSTSENRSGKLLFKNLQFTDREATQIDSILKIAGYKTEPVVGKRATESEFRKASGNNYKILHLATHGYFDRLMTPADEVEDLQFSGSNASLQKCKLAFAGINLEGNTPAEFANDGLMTAMDISQLNLNGTELVVLSACESGLGDITDAEGVQGFSRAFAIAGVKHTLVSLWNVSDQQTAELMKLFYQQLVIVRDPSRALYLAQSAMKYKYANPFYWAGFQVVRER